MILTSSDIIAVGGTEDTAEEWARLLSGSAILHEINTPTRMIFWLATLAHESAGLTRFIESLNYSATRLVEVWPARFGPGKLNPNEYARQPEKLANYVYADENRAPENRLGNTEPGDGWRFIGRGPIQITGRANYTACGEALGILLLKYPDLLLEPPVGARSAAWFCQSKGCNQIADGGSFEAYTRRVNGALVGLEDRLDKLEKTRATLRRFM